MGMMILKCSIQIWCPSWEIDHVQKTNYVRFCAAVRYAPCFLFLRADWCLFIYVFRLFSLWFFFLLAVCVLHICYVCACSWQFVSLDWIVCSFSISGAFLVSRPQERAQDVWSTLAEDANKASGPGRMVIPKRQWMVGESTPQCTYNSGLGLDIILTCTMPIHACT